VTGFGLVQGLAGLDIPVLPIGDLSRAPMGEQGVVAGMAGGARSVAARVVAWQEFAGYWEYLLEEETIFTAPDHPLWGGAALSPKRCGKSFIHSGNRALSREMIGSFQAILSCDNPA
jgi:hypothetical protein